MPKEPGESQFPENLGEEQRRQIAIELLSYLYNLMETIEKEPIVDISRPLGHEMMPPQKDILKSAVEMVKQNLEYLDPENKHFAEGLIMKAEIYLADHEGREGKKD